MGSAPSAKEQLHILMFPWLAYGHMIPYLHLSNKLAEKGHRITFLLPHKAKLELEHKSWHPSLITFHGITVPHVDPLPLGSETCSDVPLHLQNLLATAVDRSRPEVESIVSSLVPKPDLVFFDMIHWASEMAAKLNIKSVFYNIACALSLTAFGQPTLFTLPSWVLKPAVWIDKSSDYGEGISLAMRVLSALKSCDALAFRTCQEVEGEACDLLAARYNKPLFLTGPILNEDVSPLDTRWAEWLGRFGPKSIVYCCFGSQHVPHKAQLQDLALGLEMTGLPFLLAAKPPTGCASIEEAMPEGFIERVKDRGVVHGGWVQQPQILAHPSVGCFVCHCGFGSVWEGLVSETQLVFLPQIPDQVMMAQFMAEKMEVGVNVERGEEDGWVSKQSLCEAIKSVMDEKSESAAFVKNKHATWRETLLGNNLMSNYVDNFVLDLQRFATCSN